MGVVGKRVLRVEDERFLRGEATFTDDLRHPGALHVVYVRSPIAHGRLLGVNASDAKRMPGVVAVLSADELPTQFAAFPLDAKGLSMVMPRPFLARETVRYVGEPAAMVVATSLAAARDAADAVVFDLEPLAPLVDPRTSLDAQAPRLHADAPDNECFALPPPKQGVPSFDHCDVVVRHEAFNQRLAPCPIEARAASAAWDADGRLTLWATTQGPWPVQRALVELYGLSSDAVRVVSPDVGGGFGSKEALYPEILLLPWAARVTGAPVRWAEDRTESMLNMGHGRGQHQTVTLGGSRDGEILAYHIDVVQDAGAYPRLGALLPALTRTVACGPYRLPAAACTARAGVTNTTPVLAYRGAGQPEAVVALERAIDSFAAATGLDPAEVRRRHLLSADDYPWRTPTGSTYDSGAPDKAFDRCLEVLGYDELRRAQRTQRSQRSQRAQRDERAVVPPDEAVGPEEQGAVRLGIGLACFSEVIGGPDPSEFGRVEVHADGSATVHAGSFNHGQGHATTWAMVVADRLGIPVGRIRVVDGDTGVVARGGNTGGSRSAQTAGNALAQAAADLVVEGRRLAGDLLEAHPDDIVLDTDRAVFHVRGTPAVSRSWADIAAAAGAAQVSLAAEAEVGRSPRSTFSCGAHGAVVEVDVETGQVKLLRFVAVTDAGRILNPLIAEGQVHGGVAQGVGQALTEGVVYDPQGNLLTANFADYGIVSAAELPSIEALFVDEPAPVGLLGAKGLGESGAVGATAAVLNAVIDALRPLGVDDVALPVSGENVWRAIEAARR